MPLITVLYTTKTEPVRENIERELKWYDNIKQEMQIFKGGKLLFRYKEDKYLVEMGESERKRRGISGTFRMLPIVEDLEVVNYNKVINLSDKDKIEKWFDSYMNYSNEDIFIDGKHESGIDFDVPTKIIDDFLDDCESYGFKYESN